MPREIWNVEWPNVNAQRKYPFSQSASLASGDFTLPDDLLVDFSLPVNVAVASNPTLFHLKQLSVFGTGVLFSFAYNNTVFATVSVSASGFTEYATYVIQGTGILSDSKGWLTIGSLATILKYPGSYVFTTTTGRLLPTVIKPRLATVSSLSVVNGESVSVPISGDISLIAGNNVRLRVGSTGGLPTISIDAISGAGTVATCECTDVDELSPCIRTINGVIPDVNGELTLRGSECISITAGTAELILEDTCSAPCCDCRELAVVTSTMEEMQGQLQTMEMVAQRLDQELQNTQGNILASKTTGLPPV